MDDLKLELLPGHFTAGRPMSCTSCVLALAVRDKYLGTYHHAVIGIGGTATVGASPWEGARSTYEILPSKEAKKLISEFDHLFLEWSGEGTREFKKEALAFYEKYKNVEFSLKKVEGSKKKMSNNLQFSLKETDLTEGKPNNCYECAFARAVRPVMENLFQGEVTVEIDSGGTAWVRKENLAGNILFKIHPHEKVIPLIKEFDKLDDRDTEDFEKAAQRIFEKYSSTVFEVERISRSGWAKI